MTFHRIRLLALLVASIGIVALGIGCGDDDGGSSAGAGASDQAGAEQAGDAGTGGSDQTGGAADDVTTSSLSKGAYINRAEFICGRAGQGILDALEAERKEKNLPEPEGFDVPASTAALLPPVERESSELQELGAPQGDEDEVEAILAALQQGIDAAAEGEISTLGDFGKYLVPFDKLVRAYGLEGCAFGLA